VARAFAAAVVAVMALSSAAVFDQAAAGTQSFRDSCKNISIRQINGRTVVHADCDDGRTTDQFAGFTELPSDLVIPPEGCADIANDRGKLRCIGAEFPGGSWSRSCIEGRYIRNRVFQAVCAPNGTRDPRIYSSVDMNGCASFALENINGRLRCIGNANAPPSAGAPSVSDGPVKQLGKVKGGAPALSICEAAKTARARNSPAAPGLEAQCRAASAGGQDVVAVDKSPAAAVLKGAGQAADLTVVGISGPGSLKAGLSGTYTLTIRNVGAVSATVELTILFAKALDETGQVVPSANGLRCAAVGGAGQINAQLNCTGGRLAAGETGTVIVQGRGQAAGAGLLIGTLNNSRSVQESNYNNNVRQLGVTIN
jgi:hypothetical protein